MRVFVVAKVAAVSAGSGSGGRIASVLQAASYRKKSRPHSTHRCRAARLAGHLRWAIHILAPLTQFS